MPFNTIKSRSGEHALDRHLNDYTKREMTFPDFGRILGDCHRTSLIYVKSDSGQRQTASLQKMHRDR